MIVLRKTTNEAALLAKLEARMEANKSKPKKPSNMMAKLEALQKEQQRIMEEKQKQQRKR